MRPQKVDDEQLLAGLMSVFRAKGYDGASLNELASATGLQKASLYHRFPGGKKDLAIAVLNFVEQWVDNYIVSTLADKANDPEERLSSVLASINNIYDSGQSACILRAMSMDSGLTIFASELQASFKKWIGAFYQLGIELDIEPKKAKKMAHQTLIKVQGSLVIGKTIENHTLFTESLQEIRQMYLS